MHGAPEATVRPLLKSDPTAALQEYKEVVPAVSATMPAGLSALEWKTKQSVWKKEHGENPTTLKPYLPLELAARGKCAV